MRKTYLREDLIPEQHSPFNWMKWSIVLGLIAIFSGFTYYFATPSTLISPITQNTTFQFLPFSNSRSQDKIVYGFLPYWNLSKAEINPELTHIGYFGLTIGSDGKLLTQTSEGTEPGFSKLKSDEFLQLVDEAQTNQIELEVVLTQFNNDDIVAFLSSPKAHQNLIDSLDSVLLAYPFSGVNIDIEYSGAVTKTVQNNLTLFIKTLREHLDNKYSHVPLSIDMYASAANNRQIWRVNELDPYVDKIIIMAYDFHRRSSPKAGPVAPLFGGKTLYDSDINRHLKEFLSQANNAKLILGVPFYGYEWQTTSFDPQAFTFPETGATASYKRVQEIIANPELEATENWSEEALSPYVTYIEDRKKYVIYFENSRSLSYKLDYVNQLQLSGIGIWALGYEGGYRDLWDVIARKLLLN